MEELKVLEFISYGFGYGAGCGCGSNGAGYGGGDGAGYASYDKDRSYGYGRGYGCGVNYNHNLDSGTGYYSSGSSLSINGKKVYIVDGLITTINHIHGNIAKGTLVDSSLTETPCYIVKAGRYFAHGETLTKANAALQKKLFGGMPTEELITEFWKCHKEGIKYPTKDFFEWHHKLTGSCLMGRQQFAKDHNVDLEGEMTVEEFITFTKDAFGGDIIRKLEGDAQ